MSQQHPPTDFAERNDIEAMLAAAGDYVGPSEDLRPRVLETVRQHHRLTRRRYRMTVAVGAVLFIGLFAGLQAMTHGSRLAKESTSQRVARLVDDESSQPHHAGMEGLYWRLVDAMLAVRSEQAEALGSDHASSNRPISEVPPEMAAQERETGASY